MILVTKRSEFGRLVRDWLKVDIEIPSHQARIAQAQRTDMVVLSPSATESHTTFWYGVAVKGVNYNSAARPLLVCFPTTH